MIYQVYRRFLSNFVKEVLDTIAVINLYMVVLEAHLFRYGAPEGIVLNAKFVPNQRVFKILKHIVNNIMIGSNKSLKHH